MTTSLPSLRLRHSSLKGHAHWLNRTDSVNRVSHTEHAEALAGFSKVHIGQIQHVTESGEFLGARVPGVGRSRGRRPCLGESKTNVDGKIMMLTQTTRMTMLTMT